MKSHRLWVQRFSIITLFIYLLYTFWYQYAFSPINGFIAVLGLLMLLLSITTIHLKANYYYELIPIAIFILYCFITSFVFSDNSEYSLKLCVQLLEYFIPFYLIYGYVGKDSQKLNHIMVCIFLVCTLLALWSFFEPVYSVTYNSSSFGGEGLLNANVFSSYMMLGIISSTYYLCFNEGLKRVFIYFGLAIMIIAQLNAASRRGLLIALLLVVAYFHTTISLKKDEGIIKKFTSIFLFLSLIFVFVNEISFFSKHFIVFKRLQGYFNGGDRLRALYHQVALDLFHSSPVFGKGLGAVSIRIGMYSHSMFYELLACTGLIGIVLLIGYMIFQLLYFFRTSFIFSDLDTRTKLFARMMFWYLLSTLLCGIAVVLIYDSYFYILLAIFASSMKIVNNSTAGINDLRLKTKV